MICFSTTELQQFKKLQYEYKVNNFSFYPHLEHRDTTKRPLSFLFLISSQVISILFTSLSIIFQPLAISFPTRVIYSRSPFCYLFPVSLRCVKSNPFLLFSLPYQALDLFLSLVSYLLRYLARRLLNFFLSTRYLSGYTLLRFSNNVHASQPHNSTDISLLLRKPIRMSLILLLTLCVNIRLPLHLPNSCGLLLVVFLSFVLIFLVVSIVTVQSIFQSSLQLL